MFIKRFLNSLRQKVAIITQIILPLLLVLFGFLLAAVSDTKSDDPARTLTLAMLKDKEDVFTFFADFQTNKSLSAKMETVSIVLKTD